MVSLCALVMEHHHSIVVLLLTIFCQPLLINTRLQLTGFYQLLVMVKELLMELMELMESQKGELTIASGREQMSVAQAHLVDKILESLAAGTKTVSPLLASTLKTTAQYDSCNQASHSQSQINHLIRQIANPIDKTGVIGITTWLSESYDRSHNNFRH
jgi:hypothetical protein